jgi:hypothetical protein
MRTILVFKIKSMPSINAMPQTGFSQAPPPGPAALETGGSGNDLAASRGARPDPSILSRSTLGT